MSAQDRTEDSGMRQLRWVLGLFLLAAPSWGGAAPPLPVGGEFQVNSYTTYAQRNAAVALSAAGDFVVVWRSDGGSGSDTSYDSIQGQRYAAGGAALGGQFQVNTYTTDNQRSPAVALSSAGDFVVVWRSAGSSGGDTFYNSVQGQRYAAGGAALGGQFQVNTYTTDNQDSPAVALDANGNFVVVWQSVGSSGADTSYSSIQGQRYAAGGGPLGGEFEINAYTTSTQFQPSVSLAGNGDFVVVWESQGSSGGDTSSSSIQGQRYAEGGAALGSQFQVNSYTTSSQQYAAVALSAGGDFVVVWESAGSSGGDTSYLSVQGQRYAAGGAPLGGQFQANTYTSGSQFLPAVSLDSDGDFVVVWESIGSSGGDTSESSIQGQRYAAEGVALGGPFQINSYTTGFQRRPAVALSAEGDFVVAWQSYGASGGDVSGASIQGQRFRVTGELQGKVFFDQDFDGLQNGLEPGIAGVTVELYDDTLTLRRTAVTDVAGEYHLRPKEGSWHLRFVAPPAYFTIPNADPLDTLDSDADPATGETAPFSVSINVLDTTIDAGFVVFPLFWDGFESGGVGRWSTAVP